MRRYLHPGGGGCAAFIAEKIIAFSDWFSPSIVSYPSNLSPNDMAIFVLVGFITNTTLSPSGQACQLAVGEFTG
jgi:hypothetical protein